MSLMSNCDDPNSNSDNPGHGVWGLGVLADHDKERECLTEQKRRNTPISSVVGAKERHALPVVLSGADKT
jgi:hypothetical protein